MHTTWKLRRGTGRGLELCSEYVIAAQRTRRIPGAPYLAVTRSHCTGICRSTLLISLASVCMGVCTRMFHHSLELRIFQCCRWFELGVVLLVFTTQVNLPL